MCQQQIAVNTSLMAMLAVWMAGWWMLEAVHLAVTSLLPLAMFPVLGIMDMKDVATNYMEQTIFLFIGGFFLAFAIEKWMLHEWLASKILRATGSSQSRVLAGVMLTTFFLSMWLSNTATTLLLLSAVMGIIVRTSGKETGTQSQFAKALLLGLTYSATIGGIATLVGTPTNMILPAFCDRFMSDNNTVTFFNWFRLAFPFAVVFLVCAYTIIRFRFLHELGSASNEVLQIGTTSLNGSQKKVLLLFSVTAILWFTRADIDFGFVLLKGWSSWLPAGAFIKDSTVAIFMSLLLFMLPSEVKGETLLQWNDVTRLPLDVIFLFGGGFALAAGFQESGLSAWIGNSISFLNKVPLWVLLLSILCITTLLSEFASNVASIQLMLPLVLPLAQGRGEDPFILLFAATVAASFGFMMPIATAPNTIVFSTGLLRTRDMISTGFWLNVTGIVLLLGWMLLKG